MIPKWIVTAVEGLAAFSAVAGVVTYATFEPRNGMWIRALSRGRRDSGRVSLTFDDGPTPPYTNQILDLLAQMEVKGTFFVIGVSAQQHPDLLRRMDAEGHLVANHSFHHRHAGILRGWKYWEDELRRTNETIEQIIGKRPKLFRPVMGYKSPFIARAVRRQGQEVIAWRHRAMDGIPTTPRRILDRILPTVHGGDVLMMHDGIEPYRPRDAAVSVNALPGLIDGLRKKGLEIVRLDELLQIAAYAKE